MRRSKRLLKRRKCLPQSESDKTPKTAHKCANNLRVIGGERSGVDDADEDEGCGEDEENGTDVVELFEGLLCGETSGVFGREIEEVEAEEAEEDGNCGGVEEPAPLEEELDDCLATGEGRITASECCAANRPATGPTTTAK
jgi:hypothetical protein